MAVQLDACIQCNLCVRACREVQVNDVIGGMAYRGHNSYPVFDQDDPMGQSHLRGLRRVRPGLSDWGVDACLSGREGGGRGSRASRP